MKTETEFKSVESKVLKLLNEDIRCRNDDKWLTYRVMREYTNIYIPFEDFNKLPAFETIKRCRAKIQNVLKLFPPTDERIKRKRKQREEIIRSIINDY